MLHCSQNHFQNSALKFIRTDIGWPMNSGRILAIGRRRLVHEWRGVLDRRVAHQPWKWGLNIMWYFWHAARRVKFLSLELGNLGETGYKKDMRLSKTSASSGRGKNGSPLMTSWSDSWGRENKSPKKGDEVASIDLRTRKLMLSDDQINTSALGISVHRSWDEYSSGDLVGPSELGSSSTSKRLGSACSKC